MSLYCTAMIGIYCIAAPLGDTTIAINNVGIGMAARVTADKWRANFAFTDVLEPVPKEMSRACDGTNCVGYKRSCRIDAQSHICDFVIDGGNGFSTEISFTAPDDDTIKVALSHFGVSLDHAKEPIPFELLTGDSH